MVGGRLGLYLPTRLTRLTMGPRAHTVGRLFLTETVMNTPRASGLRPALSHPSLLVGP